MNKKKSKESEKPRLTEQERFCFKCKEVVNKSDYNAYYDICTQCVRNS